MMTNRPANLDVEKRPDPSTTINGTELKDNDYIGSWLCERGPYQKYIEELSGFNPSLKVPDPANKNKPLDTGNAQVVLLEFQGNGSSKFVKTEFRSLPKLKEHFQGTNEEHGKRRVYIMEGLAKGYVAAVGGHFFMDPTFFQRQERTVVWSNEFTPTSDALPQPSSLSPETTFHLQYCELRRFDQTLKNLPFFCERTGRHVGMTAARKEEKTTTGILRRKATWWSRKTTGGGWDAVILCDPQLRGFRNNDAHKEIKSSPFHNGYVDFVPPPSHKRADKIPPHPHESMFQDLCYYFENHSELLQEVEWESPTMSSLFLKKIVAAHYLQLIDYIKAMLPSLELRLSTAWKDEEEQWKSLQTISRRCGNYSDDIEDTLLSLGYPLEGLQRKVYPDWKDCQTDFQYIYFRLKILKQRADTLMQAMTGLASIAGNRQNLEEAKRVKRLNLLALFFIPLAYTSALFSMQDKYAPGNEKFRIYWASAAGAVVITFAGAWILDNLLDDAGEWKGSTALKRLVNLRGGKELQPGRLKRSEGTIYRH